MRLTGRPETTAKCCVRLLFHSRSQLIVTATSLSAGEQLKPFIPRFQADVFFSNVFPTLRKLLRQELTDLFHLPTLMQNSFIQ